MWQIIGLLYLVLHAGGGERDAPWIDLGFRNVERGIWLARDLDGWHEAGVQGGVECRHNDVSEHGRWKGHYLYFRVSNEWAFRGSRPEVWIRVEYFDGVAGQPLQLEYDANGEGTSARYKPAEPIVMTGSGRWRHHTYHLTDAYFGDRENAASDFRLSSRENATFYIKRVGAFASPPRNSRGRPRIPGESQTGMSVSPVSPSFCSRSLQFPKFLRGYSPHPYGSVSDQSYDYRPVLDRLAGRGINLVRTMPLNAWDAQPFLKADDGRYDLSRIDPAYLTRIRDFVAYANARGFIVQLSVFEHCSLRHGEVNGRYALTSGNNIQGAAVTAENFASFWSHPESPEMSLYRQWATALASATRGCAVILEVMNEPYVDTPDNIEFHRAIIKILRDAGAEKVSINCWNDACARELGPLVDYVSWHDNGFVERNAVPPGKVLQSTDTGGWHKKSDVLEWARESAAHGYHFEHMAMSDDGDTGEPDTDWAFVDALGAMKAGGG